MKKSKGFTLIELVFVIGIIALLTSIILSFLGNAKDKGGDAGKIQSLSEVRKALQLYATDNGGFPDSKTTLMNSGFITSINPLLLYTGVDNSGNVCLVSPCPSYHLAIPLKNTGNEVLNSDSDAITGGIDGTKDDCTPSGTASTPDLCYDVTP